VEAMICASAPRTSGIVSACAYYSKDETSWWVHVTKEHFPDEVERWLVVPEEKITHNANPTGVPILWMWQGRVQCFAPPDGV
jgi:hypothetical protein